MIITRKIILLGTTMTFTSRHKFDFDPFLFTYDIDSKAVISSLSFKYSCQIINNQVGTIGLVNNSNMIYLDAIKQQKSVNPMTKTCFNSTGEFVFSCSFP